MAGELVIQVIDIGRFRAIRPALDELDAARALGPDSRAVLQEAAASPFACNRYCGFADLLGRILRHPELELRVFLAPRELDAVILGVVRVLCFRNGADFSLVDEVGPSWVVIDYTFPAFIDLDWFRRFFLDFDRKAVSLAYPRHGEVRYQVLSREDVALSAAGLQRMLDGPATTGDARSAAEGLARLASEALSCDGLTLAHLSLL
jgi:hypothetical protein